jgi:hypothetical protein
MAMKASIHSGRLRMAMATRSPRCTPRERSSAPMAPACNQASANVKRWSP